VADNKTTVVKSSGGNVGLIILALAVVIAAVVGFMIYKNEQTKNNAITGAATAVTGAAKDVGDAVKP
jgi:hypothetical protein